MEPDTRTDFEGTDSLAGRPLAVANFYCSRYEPRGTVLAELELQSEPRSIRKAIESVGQAALLAKLPNGHVSLPDGTARWPRSGAGPAKYERSGVAAQGPKDYRGNHCPALVINRTRPMDQSVWSIVERHEREDTAGG